MERHLCWLYWENLEPFMPFWLYHKSLVLLWPCWIVHIFFCSTYDYESYANFFSFFSSKLHKLTCDKIQELQKDVDPSMRGPCPLPAGVHDKPISIDLPSDFTINAAIKALLGVREKYSPCEFPVFMYVVGAIQQL